MTRQPTRASTRFFRLRGEVGGVDCSFTVRPGDNLIGARVSNHIVLSDQGVSRRHALLVSGADGLTLEDLGSKNGTAVNGQRVESAQVQPGDTICLGGVTLRLEAVEASDAHLAIAVDTPATSRTPAEPDATRSRAADSQAAGGRWLTLVELVLDELRSHPEGTTSALAVVARALELEGCCTVIWQGSDQPVVVAAVGSVSEALGHGTVHEVVRRLARKRGEPRLVSVSVAPAPASVACAVVADPGQEPFGLVAVGGHLGHEHTSLLRVLALLLAGWRRHGEPQRERDQGPHQSGGLVFPAGYVVGVSRGMTDLYREMRPLAQGSLPVLITGETGVGKEHVARTLHLSSPRRSGPFVAINCAALPAELLEAELFGIGRGVATGVEEREGRFQQAQHGVLLLDEIADMSPNLQAKLLRALQEREVHPVGGRRAVPVDVRVIASTNADPLRLVAEGRFRADLYYRIAGSVLRVPPLRERRQDIGPLVEHFVQVDAAETGKAILGVTVRALAALERHPWPGNVRELEHEVRRMVYLCPHGQAIDSTLLSRHADSGRDGDDAGEPVDLAVRLAALEERLVREALERTGGNRTQAARLLGISRNGLAIKMERLGIDPHDEPAAG